MLKKILLIGIPAGILRALIGWATCGSLFSWIYKIEPTALWKLPEQMNLPMIWVVNIAIAMILVAVFGIVKDTLSQKCRILRGASFGVLVWAISTLPSTMAGYLFTNTACEVLLYQLVWGLVIGVLLGIFISVFYDKACALTCCGGNCSVKKKK
ncbi:MAG: hypothetical protein ACTSXL_03085 [Alphaproteobacteria bacterium]|nr:MAG: hypothetical protein B6I23_00725 [Rickettsiaceae bacterium 4572_127]